MYKLRLADILLAVILSFIAVSLFFLDRDKSTGEWVTVSSPNFSGRYLLANDRVVSFKGLKGEFKFSIFNREVKILETHCSHQKCKKMGTISQPGYSLICVPQSIEIVINGKKKVDVVCH